MRGHRPTFLIPMTFNNGHHHVHHLRPTGWGDAHVLV